MSEKMFVFSGKVLLCECGIQTSLKDDCGNTLSTGDIVMSYTVTEDCGPASFDGLTAVVADHYQGYLGQTPAEKKDLEKGKPFVMGIKSAAIDETIKRYPNYVWRVRRLKKYSDVIDGEHWAEYGFNYHTAFDHYNPDTPKEAR